MIIPTYNRAKLIGETLDSLVAQTYVNWECIIVDDGSTDETEEVIQGYINNDTRFQYYKRPIDRPKGGNTCRNYGFEQSRGEYIYWYDSDDIMLPDNLESKIRAFQDRDYDFVISKSKNFYENDINKTEDYGYGDLKLELNLQNFAMFKRTWLTSDIMFTRKLVESVKWNERLEAGQEYNFICKCLSRDPKGYFEDRVLSLRRMHPDSIRARRKDSLTGNRFNFHAKYQTFLELETPPSLKKKLLAWAISDYIRLQTGEIVRHSSSLAKSVYKISGSHELVLFYLMFTSRILFNRFYYRLYKLLLKRLEFDRSD